MQKIGDSTPTADENGEFTDGDPQKQITCTWIMAAWLNTLQREMIKVVQEGGLVLDPNDDTQLYQAIEKLIGDAETDLKSKTLRQIPLTSGAATHWLKIATMPPVVNSETRLEIELSGMSDYGVNATAMAVDRVYLTTRGTSAATRVTAATVGNLIQQFSLGRSTDTQNYLVGVTEEVSNGNTTKYNFWLKMSNHTGISSTMNILNSRYAGVTIISDFSGANNSATEPAGIVYATRQQFFTTANPQQAADVRNNFAARMGVSRVLTGATGPSSPGGWSVENSTWAGVPWGSVICTTNGSDLSTTGGSGRFNHYLQISHEAGGKPGLRVAVNINGTFSGWDRAMMTSGGEFSGPVTVPYVASTPDVMPEGAGAYADQLNSKAPFYQPNWQWPVNAGGIFVPIAKGTSTRKDKGYPGAVSFGYLMPANDEHPHPTIHVKGDSNVDCAWDFNPYNGNVSSKAGTFATQEWVNNAVHTNELHVGSAQMAQDGNIWGTRWNANGQWLWDAIVAQVQNIGQMSVSGTQWWAKINLNGGTLIVQGGRRVGTDSSDGVMDRVNLNISVPNRLLHVSMNIKNFGQGYDSGWNPQVGDLTNERDAFSWFHGSKDREIYWFAVGY